MGVKTISKFKELPFEIGKTYTTKFQTGEKFLLTKIKYNTKGDRIGFDGIYEKWEYLGECPLGPDRLISDRIEDGFIEICDCCNFPIKKKFE